LTLEKKYYIVNIVSYDNKESILKRYFKQKHFKNREGGK